MTRSKHNSMAKAKISNDKATPPPVSSNLWQRPKKWQNQIAVAKTYSKAIKVYLAHLPPSTKVKDLEK